MAFETIIYSPPSAAPVAPSVLGNMKLGLEHPGIVVQELGHKGRGMKPHSHGKGRRKSRRR